MFAAGEDDQATAMPVFGAAIPEAKHRSSVSLTDLSHGVSGEMLSVSVPSLPSVFVSCQPLLFVRFFLSSPNPFAFVTRLRIFSV